MRRKNFVSLGLMILSMVLLTGFVAYWLNNQFNEEKSNLQDRFLQQFISSQDQVIDSVLIEYLHPIIGDSAMAFSRPGELADTSFRHKTITTIKIDTGHDSLVGSQGTFIAVGNGEDTAHGALSLIDFSVSAKEEFFLRGVKMVMKISGDSINSFSSAGDGMSLTDTLLLKELFADRILKTTGREFSTRWFMDTSKPKENKQAWYFSANHLDPNITVEVTSVSPYVFKQIIPQILFAIILLLLSGSAFFFTYRSLKRQMELNTIREEFISNISHELKTPVATAKVALEALQNYQQIENPDIAADYLQMASSELDRLDRLTQKVLSHSQLEGNYLSLERKKT
ncbi:MAG: hypothetical protein J7L96_10380, partial [Bacteroidales bacterium]|nr:hypothetical protein [Bacteroidales bacterium]